MTDVGTTKRKRLTPRQRLKLFEAHGGVCGLCWREIEFGEKWVGEHLRPLALGGTNEPDNFAPVHLKCAEAKTIADMERIIRAKRQKAAALGIRRETKPIPSAKKPKRKPRPPVKGLPQIARRFEIK